MTTTQPKRPPLDVYKKITIIRTSADGVTYEDGDGNLQRITDLTEASLNTGTSVFPTSFKSKLEIPVPEIKTVETYETELVGDFETSTAYIRHHVQTPEEAESTIEYNVDAEDEAWLAKFVKDIRESPPDRDYETCFLTSTTRRAKLTPRVLELMIDLLEKATRFEHIISVDRAELLFSKKIPHLFRPGHAALLSKAASKIVHSIYDYWVEKRCRLKKALLRSFWPVTASNDTNPHSVFRPREKEKYKLRKKRQNDMEAFRKMQLLKKNFQHLRKLLDLIRHREKMNVLMVRFKRELFLQRIYDCADTSGTERISRLDAEEVETGLRLPKVRFDTGGPTNGSGGASSANSHSQKKKKRRRGSVDVSDLPMVAEPPDSEIAAYGGASSLHEPVVAFPDCNNHVPLFTHPLPSRETFTTSWDGYVPNVTHYVDGRQGGGNATTQFRLRGRIGRGGRVCIDRLPMSAAQQQHTVFILGEGLPKRPSGMEVPRDTPKGLLDLLPPELDHKAVKSKVDEICAGCWSDDENDENDDGEEVLVKMDDWIGAEEPYWGEERLAIGPL